MNLNWFKAKKKNYPEFWKAYLDTFNNTAKTTIEDSKFIAFDTETTGFDIKRDRILSIGAVSILNKRVEVGGSYEIYLKQEIFNRDTVKIHELIKTGNRNKIDELEALKSFLKYIENAVLVAHHANFDKNMVNEMLLRHGLGKLKNKFIDTGHLYNKSKHIIYQDNLKTHYTLDDLCLELNVPKVDRHTASGDALITAIVFLKILGRLKKQNNLNWDYLLAN